MEKAFYSQTICVQYLNSTPNYLNFSIPNIYFWATITLRKNTRNANLSLPVNLSLVEQNFHMLSYVYMFRFDILKTCWLKRLNSIEMHLTCVLSILYILILLLLMNMFLPYQLLSTRISENNCACHFLQYEVTYTFTYLESECLYNIFTVEERIHTVEERIQNYSDIHCTLQDLVCLNICVCQVQNMSITNITNICILSWNSLTQILVSPSKI